MSGDLSFEQAPPPSVPMRFFVPAPMFGVAAGVLLSAHGADALASRWSGAALAITHLLVAGFMLQAMTGGLFQFMPVAVGGNVWQPRRAAGVLQPLLLVGAVLLPAGLLLGEATLLRLAALSLGLGIGGLVALVVWALVRTPATGATVRALRLAIAALAVTAGLGCVLAEGLAGGHGWSLADLANIHAGWGLAGWGLILLAGVSYAVVPMFQLTPAYPRRLALCLPPLLGLALLAMTLQLWLPLPPELPALAVAFLAAAFALITLWLQRHRRRRAADALLRYFRTAMISLLAAAALLALGALVPAVADAAALPWLLAVLVLLGVFASAIAGMMFKILPFISWLHLQREAGLQAKLPNAADLLNGRDMIRHLYLHQAALVVLLVVPLWPALVTPAGLLAAADFAWLMRLLVGAVRRYRTALTQIAGTAGGPLMPPQEASR